MTDTSKEAIEKILSLLWRYDKTSSAVKEMIKALAEERDAAYERIKILEEALKPFANACIQFDDHTPWHIENDKYRELRRAREALGE